MLSRRDRVQTRGPLTRPGINQKYEMRPAEFRYIYGGGQFNDTHSRSRVIVNISIRSTPTTHAYADKPCSQRCFMWVQGAFDSAMRRASCCHLFAHYITLLPSRVSPANLHYKCRWCYHRFAYTLWRRWRIVNGAAARSFMYMLVRMMLPLLRATASRGASLSLSRHLPPSLPPSRSPARPDDRSGSELASDNRVRFALIELLTTVRNVTHCRLVWK